MTPIFNFQFSIFNRQCSPALHIAFPLLLVLSLSLLLATPAPAQDIVLLSNPRLHLGTAGQPEYDVFANPPTPPQSPPLELTFPAQPNPSPWTLFLRQDDVKETWNVELNGRRLGALFAMEAPLRHTLTVPANTLKDGDNLLRILPPRATDDIFVGDIRLHPAPLADAIHQATLDITVTDADSGQPLPCRLTLVDGLGSLSPVHEIAGHHQRLAVRPGVVYTADGRARLGVPAGKLTVHATRGFEYGLDTQPLILEPGQSRTVNMKLRREVDTRGWVACDTHTHTFTFSRHGDATIEERAITLAGEGIELPIATDHNILTDYTEAAQTTGTAPWFTPVIGDEVTTRQAHFNVFPITAGSRVPDFRIEDWTRLLENIRATPGVEVVILNHPMNVHNAFQPFAPTNFNTISGEILRPLDFNVDALELLNSSAQQSDMMTVYNGWFALLNAGHRITGVGSSDGHDVSRYIIGQGRTYIRCDDHDPGRLDASAALENFKAGRTLISMGLLADLTVNESFTVGDLATAPGDSLDVVVKVQGPAWTACDRIALFANGMLVREHTAPVSDTPGLKARVEWNLPKPPHDVHLVALATGPGVAEPYWAIPRPYQSSSTAWTPRVAASTNPVWVDADGDGTYSSPKASAERFLARHPAPGPEIVEALDRAGFDTAIVIQTAALCRARGLDLRTPEFQAALDRASPPVQKAIRAYVESLSPK